VHGGCKRRDARRPPESFTPTLKRALFARRRSLTTTMSASRASGQQGAGKMRLEGREYVVADGDVMHFRFNV